MKKHFNKDNLSIAISVVALVIGILSYFSSSNKDSIRMELEANDLINSAWDDLGGREGIDYFEQPKSIDAIYSAKRKILKALKIDKDNVKAQALHAILLFHSAIKNNDPSEMERSSLVLKKLAESHQDAGQATNIYYLKSLIHLRKVERARKILDSLRGKSSDLDFLDYDMLYAKSWL